MLSTNMVVLGVLAVHFDFTNFAHMSLYYVGSFHCVIVHYVLYQRLSSLEHLSTGVALFFGDPMGCVDMIHKRDLIVCYFGTYRTLVLILLHDVFIMLMYY